MGIVGAAAAGKSTLSQLLCAAGNTLWGTSWAQCISMDAYSFPNSRLSATPAVDHLGRPCTLKDMKGLPSTLDAEALLRDIRRLCPPTAQTIFLPAYDRDLHDPVPNAVAVAPDCRVVLVEGKVLQEYCCVINNTVARCCMYNSSWDLCGSQPSHIYRICAVTA